jgi:excinuclease ABC subunit C
MIDIDMLPENPGCYLFSNDAGEIIYIGKAKNLKKRLSSYFRQGEHDQKTEALMQRVRSVDFIITKTEVEALILENTLIKKYQPKYNISLKDSKDYAFIQITSDEFPRIGITRTDHAKGRLFGPFVSAKERDYVLSVIKTIFHLRSCQKMPKRPCLRYHIGSCSAPCIGRIDKDEYLKDVKMAGLVLEGKIDELIQNLRSEMLNISARLEFERAIKIRDQITAVERLKERQMMKREKKYDEDIINYVVSDGRVYLMLFHVYKGTLEEKQEFIFGEDDDFLDEFLVQYYSDHEPPSELILPDRINDAVINFLSLRRERRVKITVPKKGDKKRLLDLVGTNIEIRFFGNRLKIKSLERVLMLPRPPKVIECFDISHLSGRFMVGSMVQFRDGRPDKKNYRRFKIRTVDRIDDFAAIAEVVFRRYSRLLKENGRFPDLIIIDGGKGQLSSAFGELKKLGLNIPLIAIAKREEEVYLHGRRLPLQINKDDKALLFIREIRDEAHRFAIEYNRMLRTKKVIK